jgi:molybdopterin molybdotransferase
MAEQAIAARLTPLPAEALPLAQCVGRTLREDIYAERDNPPFDRVCMDGIAIASAAFAGGVRRFRIAAMQPAGAPALSLAQPDHAVEVMTGAIMPRGTDCVIPLEEYEVADGTAALKADARGVAFRNVQRRGEDSRPDVPMLRAGVRLGAPEIAVAASAGLARVRVSRQPRLMVVSTGDELIEPGEPIAEHQVRRSNAYAVLAALREHGFTSVADDHLPDDEALLKGRLGRHLEGYDALILSGGISKGKFDLVPKVLNELGVQESFHQVAQRPGMPMWFGTAAGGQLVFGLPGNPVSTLLCLIRYVLPALGAAMGAPRTPPEPIGLAAPVKGGRPMTYFLPVAVRRDELGRARAEPRPPKGSGDFLALAGTQGFVELPPRTESFPEGFVADLYRW